MAFGLLMVEDMMDATQTKIAVEQGFSLFELLVTLAVMSVLAAVSIPTISDILARQQLKGAARYVMGDFNNYRMKAVKERHNIHFLFNQSITAGGATYIADSTHYIIWSDKNSNDIEDGGEVLLRSLADSYPRVTITDAAFSGTKFYFKYMGTISNQGHVSLTSDNGFTRQVIINMTGSSHVE